MNGEAKIRETETERRGYGSVFALLLAGLGIGAVLSVLLAPQPGSETRRQIGNKFLDGLEDANAKVHQTWLRMNDLMDESQRRVTRAVATGREMFGGARTGANSERL